MTFLLLLSQLINHTLWKASHGLRSLRHELLTLVAETVLFQNLLTAIFHFLEHALDPPHLLVGFLFVYHKKSTFVDAFKLIKSPALDLHSLTVGFFLITLRINGRVLHLVTPTSRGIPLSLDGEASLDTCRGSSKTRDCGLHRPCGVIVVPHLVIYGVVGHQ